MPLSFVCFSMSDAFKTCSTIRIVSHVSFPFFKITVFKDDCASCWKWLFPFKHCAVLRVALSAFVLTLKCQLKWDFIISIQCKRKRHTHSFAPFTLCGFELVLGKSFAGSFYYSLWRDVLWVRSHILRGCLTFRKNIGLQLTYFYSPLFSVSVSLSLALFLLFWYLQHYHSGTEHCLSKGTNMMKTGAVLHRLYIPNQAGIEAEKGGGFHWVISSRLNNWSHLIVLTDSYCFLPQRAERDRFSWRKNCFFVISFHSVSPSLLSLLWFLPAKR